MVDQVDRAARAPALPAKMPAQVEIAAETPRIFDGSMKAETVAAADDDGTGCAVWIHGDDTGTRVQLHIQAIKPADAAEFGPGVYLTIEGMPNRKTGEATNAPLAKAVKRHDGTVCVFLSEQAKLQLMEELERHREIVSLHQALAKGGV